MSATATPAKPDLGKIVADAIAPLAEKVNKIDTAMTEIREKAAQVQPPRVALGHRPGSVSQPYSVIRAAALACGRISKDQAPYEADVALRLKKLYAPYQANFQGGMLVPSDTASVEYYAQDGDQEMVRAMEEVRLRVKGFGLSEVDPNLRQKSIGGVVAQNTLSDTDGGLLRGFPTLGDLIELQRNQEVFSRLGAQEISLPPNGMMLLPKQTGGTVAYWANEAQAVTRSQVTLGKLELQAKKLFVLSYLTGEMIRFVTPNMEAMLRSDMAAQTALEADRAMFYGASNDRIKGLFTYDTATEWAQGVDKVLLYTAGAPGTDGDTFQPEDPDNMMALLPDPVQNQTGRKWAMRNDLFARIRNRRADAAAVADGKGPYLFDITRSATDKGVEELRGYDVVRSSQVAKTETKGSATDLTSVVHGLWSDWIIARFGVMEFLSTNTSDTAITNDLVVLRGIQYLDAGARHAASFVRCKQLRRI